ncbi:MAG: precorrin-3B C(17)-methyltransferase, partial [Mariprofundaceae bacterium]|nr:precorrin-3B C(17)-methyltransferase [Mariprofundaceae bacterium]
TGSRVVYVTEGDPTLYSTAAYVWQLLREHHPDIPMEIVPGISSVTAAAARVGWPLALQGQPVLIVPAQRVVEDNPSWLQSQPMLCLLKPSRTIAELASRLHSEQHEAVYVENLGTGSEWITHNLAEAVQRDEYFSLVLWRQRLPAVIAEPKGKVWIVGIGPGKPQLLTQQARTVLHSVDVIVGYDGYLQHVESLDIQAERIGSPIGGEAERARQGLELAAAGKRVAVISSGDAGVYGMASLLLEQSEHFPEVDIEIVPGVTAALSAAALLGAPLGHDFACISLSDLLTPWPEIERRLAASAQGDFVIVLYNPVSRQRNWQLPRAREILLAHRDANTPVGIVDKAYRDGTQVRQTSLAGLSSDGISMESTLIVGNRQTRWIQGRMVTPRGYTPNMPSRGRQLPEEESTQTASRHIIEESFAIIDRETGQ